MKNLMRGSQLTKKTPAPLKSVPEMRAFLKEHDPKFATDLYLDSLSFNELAEYYRDCADALNPAYSDDWDERFLRVRANNM